MIIDGFNWDGYKNSQSEDEINIESHSIDDKKLLNSINNNEIIKCTVISMNLREITVNVDSKIDGVISTKEFRYNPELKVGDIVEGIVENQTSRNGVLIISHRKARLKIAWEKINKAFENNEIVPCYVVKRTNGGMIVYVYDLIEAFLPDSQINTYDCVGKDIDVKIININDEFKNVVVSHKMVEAEKNFRKKINVNLLKDIWQKHTEVQEQILRQRTAPLTIVPSKTTVVNDKLHVFLNTSDNTEQIQNDIIDTFKITEENCHFEDGYIIVPIENWNQLSDSEKHRLSLRANQEYISFSSNPVIDGKITDKNAQFTGIKRLLDKLEIDYNFDKNRRLQIAINDLHRLKVSADFSKLQVSLPDIASAIVPTYPSILCFIERFCPNHNFKNIETFRDGTGAIDRLSICKELVTEGGYFNDDMLAQIQEIFDIKMCRVEFDFKINEDVLNTYDWSRNILNLPNEKDGIITFRKKINRGNSIEVEEIYDVFSDTEFFNNAVKDLNFEYMLNRQIIDKIFGKGNYEVTERYFYEYKENRTWATPEELDRFNDQLHLALKNMQFGIQRNGTSLGIDFNWKDSSLPELLTQLSQEYGFIDFMLYASGHKCNFDIEYKKEDLIEIKEDLRNTFENLNVELTKKGTELSFFKEFSTIEDLQAFKPQLSNKLNSFDSVRYSYSISDVPSDCIKLLYFFDKQSRDEDRVDAVKELKGADFLVEELSIGKLIRISSYPEVVLDISGDNYDITKKLFEESDVEYITPDLSGDLEKLARLKESLNRIIEGRDVENVSLGDFIFDASQAKGIRDFDENIKFELQEISKHVLNKNIDRNEPQKMAIAKALLSPDLALIQGPPGTGKSTAIAELIWQHTRKFPDKRILLTSETNLAVDNAIDRVVNDQHNLIKPIRIGDESRLESEGLQFSYPAMYRWANGEDFRKKKNPNLIYDEDEDVDESTIATPVYKAPEKLILLNWMENIGKRIDKVKIPLEAQILWQELLNDPTSDLKKLFFDNYVSNCNVIAATCSSIGQKNIIHSERVFSKNPQKFVPTQFYRIYKRIFGKKMNENPKLRFDMVIQDESSKATPAELSLPLIYGVKNVIIGDHRQLPPMLSREDFINSFDYSIKRANNEVEKKKMKELKKYVLKNFNTLEVSHFERLYNQIDANLKGVFNYQFRMHPAINDVIKQFYKDDGGLECGLVTPKDLGVNDPDFINNGSSRYHGITAGPISPDTHVLWIDSSSPEMLDGTSRVNYGEVKIIKKLLTELYESESFRQYTDSWTNIEDKQIGLISFYGKQLRLLQEMTRDLNTSHMPIRVSTVDRFQGMERNIIIVSMVRSHCIQTEKEQKPNFDKYPEFGYPDQKDLGFAQSPNRLNVALSRARRLLIIVGNSKLFRTMDIYDNVYKTISDPQNKYGKIITAQEYGL